MTIRELAAMFGGACLGAFICFFGLAAMARDDFGGGLVVLVAAFVFAPIGFVVGGTVAGVVILFRRPRDDGEEGPGSDR